MAGKVLAYHREMRARRSAEIWIAEDNEDVRLMLERAFKRGHPAERPLFFEDGARYRLL